MKLNPNPIACDVFINKWRKEGARLLPEVKFEVLPRVGEQVALPNEEFRVFEVVQILHQARGAMRGTSTAFVLMTVKRVK